jgi:hypothetical protein
MSDQQIEEGCGVLDSPRWGSQAKIPLSGQLWINQGFKSTASKEDLKAVTARLDGIDSRLDRIETLRQR